MKPFLCLAVWLATYPLWSQTPTKSELITVNGHQIYYEIHGQGSPLLLLHGFSISSKSWLDFLPEYTKKYEVYLVDLQGHGKSENFKESLSIAGMAKDVGELMKHLGIKQLDAIGFSMGGDVLFHLAVHYPDLIRSMISIGAVGFWDSHDFPGWLEWLSNKNRKNLTYMNDQHRNEEQIRIILDQLPYYKTSLTDAEMSKINANVMILIGDRDDGIPLEYLARVRKNLPNTFFWILPNTGHPAHYGKHKETFVKLSLEFLQGAWIKK